MPVCPICRSKCRFFLTIGNYIYCECHKCQTLFLHNGPKLRELNSFYATSFSYEAGKTNEQRIRQRSRIILKNLKKLNPSGKTLLDVGSGYGYLLDEAHKFNVNAIGIEPSRNLFKHSVNKKVINIDLEDYFKRKPVKRFDFITLVHVIEHIKNPQKWLGIIRDLLNPGGILFIETPNLDSHLFNFEKYYYTFLTPPEHLWIFSKYSFVRLLRKITDLKLIKHSTYSYPEHFMGILKKILVRKAKIPVLNDLGIPERRDVLTSRSEGRAPTRVKNAVSSFFKRIKYLIIDKIFAKLLFRLLNIGNKGSFLELYIKKI